MTTIAEETMTVPAEPAAEELSLKEQRGQVLLGTITAAHFSHHVANSLLNPLLPLIRTAFGLSYAESGFAVSAARIGAPDTQLISYGEMVDQGRNLCAATSLPVIGDADTGYGNAVNVRRTVLGYAQAGFACAMIEDQVAPKRCGHTRGKQVVEAGHGRRPYQ